MQELFYNENNKKVQTLAAIRRLGIQEAKEDFPSIRIYSYTEERPDVDLELFSLVKTSIQIDREAGTAVQAFGTQIKDVEIVRAVVNARTIEYHDKFMKGLRDNPQFTRVPYPEDEEKSWDRQFIEAEAYVADQSYDAVLLKSMAAQRKELAGEVDPVLTLAQRIIANHKVWEIIRGTFIGLRLDIEDDTFVDGVSAEDIAAINIEEIYAAKLVELQAQLAANA